MWSNVVALDESKPHTLPSGVTFFRVNESLVGRGNIQADKFILAIQVFNPDSLEAVNARLSDDRRVVIVTIPDPDKFVHENRQSVAHQLSLAVTGGAVSEDRVRQNYLSSLSKGYSQADEHYADTEIDIDIPMKKVFCILPPGIKGSNAYFNDGELDFFVLTFQTRKMLTTFVLDFSDVSDKSQLQPYPYVLTNLFDLEDLKFQGLTVLKQNDDKGGELVTDIANVCGGETAEEYSMRIINKVSCMSSKGLFVCFQVIIDGTTRQNDIRPNGAAGRRAKKFNAFDNMSPTGNKSLRNP